MNTENTEKAITNETAKKSSAGKSVKKNIYRKLLAIQTTLKAPKNLFNSYGKYNYRNAESILEAVKPFLLEQGCVLLLRDEIEVIGSTVNSQTDEKGVKTVKEMARRYVKAIATLIDCETGESIETSAYANECEHTGMSGDQCTGTASSYARKYCLNALFLLDDTKDSDTDEMKNIENGASKPTTQGSNWATGSKKPTPAQSAPAGAPAQPAAQTPQTQPSQASGWSKKTTSNGWGKSA